MNSCLFHVQEENFVFKPTIPVRRQLLFVFKMLNGLSDNEAYMTKGLTFASRGRHAISCWYHSRVFTLLLKSQPKRTTEKSLLIPITSFLSSLSYSFSTPFTTTSTNSSVGKQTLNTQVFRLSVIYVKHQFIWRRYYFQSTISWI